MKDKYNNEIKLFKYDTFFKKLKGFMFKKNIDYAIYFNKVNSIHTFFMKECIDVIMTDKNFKILYIFKSVKPNKIILPKKGVYYTFELPPSKLKFNIGERIVLPK